MKKIMLLCIIGLMFMGCTDNQRARSFGGTTTETLPKGKKLVQASWKQDNLWLLTRPMKAEETPETYEMRESSSFGMMNGTVVIIETK